MPTWLRDALAGSLRGARRRRASQGDRRVRLVIASAAPMAVVAPRGWLALASRLPDAYAVTDMGYTDTGGRPPAGSHAHHAVTARDVTSLTADPARPADVSHTLVAREQRFRLTDGRTVDGYTLNGTSPGPVIRAAAGQLVQVRLVNGSVRDGVTLHWHGVDVPNAADGVAGVTQDAVRVGGQ